MTSEQKAELEKLIQAGVPQYLICKQLNVGRGVVQNFRRSHGLLGKKPGVPCPDLSAEQQSEVLSRLQRGQGTQLIARAMGVQGRAVRGFAERIGFKHSPGSSGYRLSAQERKKIVLAIQGGKTNLTSIAKRSPCSHTTIKKIARRVLGAPLTGGGSGREGLRSAFATKHYDEEEFPWLRKRAVTNSDDFGRLAELIERKCFHGKLPCGLACEIACAVLQTCLADEQDTPALHAFFLELCSALLAREAAQNADYVS